MNKKTFFSIFMFAVSALMSISLTGCGDGIEVAIHQQGENNGTDEGRANEQLTVLSSNGNGTRTSMDKDRVFYWETGDNIWLDEARDGSFTTKLDECKIAENKKTADFYLRGKILKEKTYDIIYSGNNSSSATSVTIAAEQTQTKWNNAEHFGVSGDCGVATANRDNSTGKYSFSIKHQAAYLVFTPYKNTIISDGWKLMKIEIIADGTTIAGTYPFSMSGLNTSSITNGKDTVALNCNNEGFTLPASSDSCCFAVIQPGTHTLKIKYTIKPTGSVNGVAGETFTITKEIASRPYRINGVTTIRHKLNVNATYSPLLFHMWDAVNPYWYGVSESRIPRYIGAGNTTDRPLSASDSRNRWCNTAAVAPTQASRSCRNLPNVNLMTWYVNAGDPRWDRNFPWIFDGNSGAAVYTLGAWFLKRDEIAANKGVSPDIMDSRALKNNGTYTIDARSTLLLAPDDYTSDEYANVSTDYASKGRPTPDEIDKYFFLPAMSHIAQGMLGASLTDAHCCYWTASPAPNYSGPGAYYLGATNTWTRVMIVNRSEGRPVVPDLFQ